MPSRTFRYSGSDRPAWRMNHTGVRDVASPRQARTRSDRRGRRAVGVLTGEILARGAVDPRVTAEGYERPARRDTP